MQKIDQLIAAQPFFAGFAPADLELMASCARNDRFDAGSFIFREGDAADRFHLLREGRVSLETHGPASGPIVIETRGPGDALGFSWLFPPHRMRFDARVLETAHTISFDGKCLRGKCDADHDLGYRLLNLFGLVILDRLQATRLQLLDVYGSVGPG